MWVFHERKLLTKFGRHEVPTARAIRKLIQKVRETEIKLYRLKTGGDHASDLKLTDLEIQGLTV